MTTTFTNISKDPLEINSILDIKPDYHSFDNTSNHILPDLNSIDYDVELFEDNYVHTNKVKDRSVKALTGLTPGEYLRKVSNPSLSCLGSASVETPLYNLTKLKLVNDFEIQKAKTIQSLADLNASLRKICTYDTNYRRNERRRLARRKANPY